MYSTNEVNVELRKKLREAQEKENHEIFRPKSDMGPSMKEIVWSCIVCGYDCGEELPTAILEIDGSIISEYDDHPLAYTICPKCGFIWQTPQLKEDDLYASIEDSEAEKIWLEILEDQKETDREKYAMVWRMLVRNGLKQIENVKLLDIGCSSGIFMEFATERLMQRKEEQIIRGIELNKDAAKIAQKKGLIVVDMKIEDTWDEPKAYNIITLLEVLEHLKNPKDTIRQVHEMLTDNGLLVIIVPNGDALALRILREKCTMLGKDHLWLFTPNTLRRFIESFGFYQEESFTIYPAFQDIERALNLETSPQLSDTEPSPFLGRLLTNFRTQNKILQMGMGYKIVALFRRINEKNRGI